MEGKLKQNKTTVPCRVCDFTDKLFDFCPITSVQWCFSILIRLKHIGTIT